MTTKTKPSWSAPDARLELPITATPEQWQEFRTTGIGGSDAPILTGNATYKTPYELWLEKTGQVDPKPLDGDHIWFGHKIEPVLADWFEEQTGIKTRQCGSYRSKTQHFMLANPDRLTADGGILEIKSTESFAPNGKLYAAGEIPAAHYDQVQQYMWVTGRLHAHIVVIIGRKKMLFPVDYNPEYAEALVRIAGVYWHEHVQTGKPPALDIDRITEAELKARYPKSDGDEVEVFDQEQALADHARLTELKARIKSDGEEVKAIETHFKALIGDHEYLTAGGERIARWQEVAGRKSFDKQAVLTKLAADRGIDPTPAALKEIEAEFTKQGDPYRRFTLTERTAA